MKKEKVQKETYKIYLREREKYSKLLKINH